jgi:putative Mg2+ transporter-C (MgtC) family protein
MPGVWWQGLLDDFSDLPNLGQILRLAVRLLLAALLGGILGFEREQWGKAAGLRTHMLVALGAALFVLIPQQMGESASDLSRVMQGVVSGIGFIGAGAILKQEKREVQGVTTAAGLWLTAAVGIAAGLGREASAILGTFLALLILSVLPRAVRGWRDGSAARPPVDPAHQDGGAVETESVSGRAAQFDGNHGTTRANSSH